jgi:hypothetical protein
MFDIISYYFFFDELAFLFLVKKLTIPKMLIIKEIPQITKHKPYSIVAMSTGFFCNNFGKKRAPKTGIPTISKTCSNIYFSLSKGINLLINPTLIPHCISIVAVIGSKNRPVGSVYFNGLFQQ